MHRIVMAVGVVAFLGAIATLALRSGPAGSPLATARGSVSGPELVTAQESPAGSTMVACGGPNRDVPLLGNAPIAMASAVCEAVVACVARCTEGMTPQACGVEKSTPIMTAADCEFLARAPISAVDVYKSGFKTGSRFGGEVFYGKPGVDHMIVGVTMVDGKFKGYGWGQPVYDRNTGAQTRSSR